MDYNGNKKKTWEGGKRYNWWSPYTTLGAAIDTAIADGYDVKLCGACNPNHGIE